MILTFSDNIPGSALFGRFWPVRLSALIKCNVPRGELQRQTGDKKIPRRNAGFGEVSHDTAEKASRSSSNAGLLEPYFLISSGLKVIKPGILSGDTPTSSVNLGAVVENDWQGSRAQFENSRRTGLTGHARAEKSPFVLNFRRANELGLTRARLIPPVLFQFTVEGCCT